jgi:hypothetical protein
MLGALFAMLLQQTVIIYYNVRGDSEIPNEVIMSTYVVTDGALQIYGAGSRVTYSECEKFRRRIHNPPTDDNDLNWAVTICEIIDPERLEVEQDPNTQQEPADREVSVPGPQTSNQQPR